ncbi:MAG: carboxypeptidase-like regulatory domain-containing protein [Cyclobacteriaceae bacterium]|nr:carboxypeptidase-like regulatory domain-containing protein [Cyclobacteriaceae bacterium]
MHYIKYTLLLFSFILLCSTGTSGQNYITITGVVVDAESGDPLIFASIGIRNKSIGTITNAIGEFDFHIPVENRNSVIEINMLGYESYTVSVNEIILTGINRFELTKSSKFLQEVVISDSLSGGDIFNIAVSRIENNYPMTPFLMDGFYRDIKSVAGTHIALLEAAVKIYDKEYDEPRQKTRLRERVALIEVRKSLGYDNKFTSFFDQTNLLEDLLLHNIVRYRQFPEDPNFLNQLKREETSFYNGRKIFLVTLKESDRIKLYIDAMTFAFIRIEYQMGPQEGIIDRKNGLESKLHSLQKIIEFKEYSGKMYLSHIDLLSEIHWIHPRTKELKFTTELQQQLLINNIWPNTSSKIGTTEKMKRFGLQYQYRNYNKGFWDNYNVIKETPLNKKIVEDLEKDLSLEKQFTDTK